MPFIRENFLETAKQNQTYSAVDDFSVIEDRWNLRLQC